MDEILEGKGINISSSYANNAPRWNRMDETNKKKDFFSPSLSQALPFLPLIHSFEADCAETE